LRIGVVIATAGRREQVALLLRHLEKQVMLPAEVIVSAPGEGHVPLREQYRFPVSFVFGKQGSSVQRNTALEHARGRFDVITFFDDDFVPADDYLRLVAEEFELHNWAVVMGHAVRDGASGAGLTWQEAIAALGALETEGRRVVDHVGAYGCNMSVREAFIESRRFDERLVLYGWQEDIDFTSQLRARGRVVGINTICGVHLGVKSGRVSGERFGYSQVANPVYLIRKGTVPAAFLLPLMCRNIAANLVRSLRPEPYVDRRGRLQGNLLALLHVMTGRVEPEHILKM
jgi:hypothetical protein